MTISTLINTQQAAAMLGISPATLERQRVVGGGIPYVKIGAAVRYRAQAIADFIAANTFTSTSEVTNVR